MKRKPPTQGGNVTHSETPTQARIDHDRTRSKSECDGATEVNAKLEGWQEKQRVIQNQPFNLAKTAENLGKGTD